MENSVAPGLDKIDLLLEVVLYLIRVLYFRTDFESFTYFYL